MSEQKNLAKRLREARRELDEVAEYLERIATDISETTPVELELVGQAEAAALLGITSNTFAVYVSRGLVPEPVARLACGRVWLRSQIAAWDRRRNAA
jgi:hypothetical protein